MTMLSSVAAKGELGIETGVAVERTFSQSKGTHFPGRRQHFRSEQLAILLADAQAEFDHLHSITRRAGYQIIFRDRSGAIIDPSREEHEDTLRRRARGGLTPSVLQRIHDYVEANLELKLELSDLAAIANLSRCHFTYAFKQSVGCTPHRFVMSRRLERARQLLLETHRPTVEIALATGFADQSHFCRCFRAFLGISPVAYRRSHR
jgi:transcriptional regulator GlxA family with amidase domain